VQSRQNTTGAAVHCCRISPKFRPVTLTANAVVAASGASDGCRSVTSESGGYVNTSPGSTYASCPATRTETVSPAWQCLPCRAPPRTQALSYLHTACLYLFLVFLEQSTQNTLNEVYRFTADYSDCISSLSLYGVNYSFSCISGTLFCGIKNFKQ
jgi:hypothetical protein